LWQSHTILTFDECRLQVAFAPASLPHLTIDMTSLPDLQQVREGEEEVGCAMGD
jgi:hypothetical protein